MNRLLIAILALPAILTSSSASAQGGVIVGPGGAPAKAVGISERIFEPARNASKDIADGVKLAAKQHKRVILDVGGNWCPWCHKLDATFRTDAAIARILKDSYVVVRVNFSPENENREVLSRYPKIEGYPHLFVLDRKGKLLHSQDTGLLETGDHHDHDKVVTFLSKWAPEPRR